MQVTIIGPNLQDQSKGTFHVHKAGCKDLSKPAYRLNKVYGLMGDTVEVSTKREAAEYVYPVDEFEYWAEDPDGYINDLWFAPCTRGLR
jgi:hypothetical protein